MPRAKGQKGLTFPGLGKRLNEAVRRAGYADVAAFARDTKRDKGRLYASAKKNGAPSDLLTVAAEIEAPWQWLLVGDECAEALIAYREGRWKPDAGASVELLHPISSAVPAGRAGRGATVTTLRPRKRRKKKPMRPASGQ